MTVEDHHQDALIETARLELDRAHRAALGMQAGEVRRGLELALAALQAAEAGESSPTAGLASRIGTALADLDRGSLVEMAQIIEAVRKEIEA